MRNFLFYLFAVLAFAMVSCEMPEGPVDDLPDDPNTEQPGGSEDEDNGSDKPGDDEGDKPSDDEGDKPGDEEGDKPSDEEGDKPSDEEGDKPGDEDPAEVVFELQTPSKVDIAAAGGDYTIKYTLTGAAEEAVVEVEVVNKDMITRVDSSLMGYVDLFFSVNTSEAKRDCAVLLKYEDKTLIVLFEQAGAVQEDDTPDPEDVIKVEIEAKSLVGNYYGDKLADGLGHYWLIFSEEAFVNGAVAPNTNHFRLDILGPMAKDNNNVIIPDGVYKFDSYNSLKEYTILNMDNTDYTWVDEYGEGWAYKFYDAVLTVSGNHFELVASVEDKEYHVTYDGDYNIAYSTITDYVSSLTRDAVIDVSNCSVSVSSYGDYWKCGYNNWVIEFVCNDGLKNGTYLVIDFLNSSTTDFTGTYEASGFSAEDPTKPDFRSGVFIPGFRVADDADLLLGSLYMVYKDGLCVSQAPLYTGSVDIKYNYDNTYTIKIDAYDDAPRPNKLTLNWTGKL